MLKCYQLETKPVTKYYVKEARHQNLPQYEDTDV